MAIIPAEPALPKAKPSAKSKTRVLDQALNKGNATHAEANKELNDTLDDVCKLLSSKIGIGNTANATTGSKILGTLQAAINSYKWVIAYICRKPSMIPSAEPLINRDAAPIRIVAAQVLPKQPWAISTPQTVAGMTSEAYTPRLNTRPEWAIVLYGNERPSDEPPLAAEEIAERELALRPDASDLAVNISGALQVLVEGDTDSKMQMILKLHRRE